MDVSREFMPVSRISKSEGFLTDEKMFEQQASQPPMPRILVRLASCVGVLHMRDPGIITYTPPRLVLMHIIMSEMRNINIRILSGLIQSQDLL